MLLNPNVTSDHFQCRSDLGPLWPLVLQNLQRLILCFQHKRTEVPQRSPDGDRRENKYAGSGFALRHAECHPDQDRPANKCDWIILGADRQPTAENRFAEPQQQKQNKGYLQIFLSVPPPSWLYTPKNYHW